MVKSKQGLSARSQRKRQQARNEILDATREVVLEHGLAGFTLDDVAERTELTKPALYYYFRSKDELAAELFLREWSAAADAVEASVEQTESAAEALEALVRTYVEYYAGRPDLFLMTHAEVPRRDNAELFGPAQLERIRPTNDQLYGGSEQRIESDRRSSEVPPNPRRLVFVAHLAAIGLLTYKTLVESVGDPLIYSDEELIEEIVRLLHLGLAPHNGDSQ